MESQVYHIPALLEDSINGLNINPDGVYVDVTFGFLSFVYVLSFKELASSSLQRGMKGRSM